MARPPFARRASWDLGENRLASLITNARAHAHEGEGTRARALVDLTESNPTRCGLAATEPLIALLGHPRGALYSPSSLGHPAAREAVSMYYADRGLAAPPDRIALSASTSEAYGWLLKLFCERGDRVLVPAPSYPLLEYLAALEDVELTPYPLLREERFRPDIGALERAIVGEREREREGDERARAIVMVHPNNPTGSFIRRDDAEAIEELAERYGLALIVDEVFGDFAHGALPPDRLPSFVGRDRALTFVLSGLSKVIALPQVKLGWVAASGPRALLEQATARLEVIADTYLSVSTPVQLALPELLAARAPIQRAILGRVTENLAALDAAITAAGPDTPIRRLPVDGGWYAMLEVPRTIDEDAWLERLVEEAGVIVHPGYFFDMQADGYLVVSLLPEPAAFAAAAARITEICGA